MVLQALETEILRKLQNQYPDMVTRVGFSSQQRVNISGTKIVEDKTRIEEILKKYGWMMVGSQKKQQRLTKYLKGMFYPMTFFLLIREAFYTFINWRNIDSNNKSTFISQRTTVKVTH